MQPPRRYGFLFVFAVPALLPLGYLLGRETGFPNLFAFLPLIVMDVGLPILEFLVGRDSENPASEGGTDDHIDGFYEAIVFACLPVFLLILAWSGHVLFVEAPFNLAGAIGWTFSVGYIGGITAINASHELIHRRNAVLRAAGGVLLSSVCYSGFKVEHVRGHHVHVSTPEDASSARQGQGLYDFLPRAVFFNSINAWKLEANRLRTLALPAWHWRNELIAWHSVTLAILLAHWLSYGSAGVMFFLGQSAFAIFSLETINYIEHYGLRRRKLENGRYERPNITHSWNSCHLLSNLMLFNLARHSDHHAEPTRPYPLLRHHDASPQLPAGYSAMFVLASVPPLWRRVMDPRVKEYEKSRAASHAQQAAPQGGTG
jgi:alkane 1-monooxygenase